MDIQRPKEVKLLPRERELWEFINSCLNNEEAFYPGEAAEQLAKSLLKREAIPKIRLRYFTDPKLNVGGRGKSRKNIFERNGCAGDAMLKHRHFLKYLKYFIYGPDLPTETIDRFLQVIIDDAGTSGEILNQLRKCAREEARKLSRQRIDLHEKFFKLALECGVNDFVALSVREAVMSVK